MNSIDKINDMLRQGESLTVEFKLTFDRETIETLVAFASTQGGTVLVGVADDGAVRGVTVGKETLNDWLGQVKSATSPAIIPDILPFDVAGKTVVMLRVHEYPVKPINTKGKYFRRVASSNHQLGLSEITDLYMQSLQLSWDSYPAAQESLDALSLDKIDKFIATVNECGRFTLDNSPLLALEKLKLIKDSKPTWAALLLFAEKPLRHHIHIGRFKTPTLIIDDRQITDTLFEAVEQAMRFIVSHVSVSFHFDGGLQRKERFAYPLPALREALLNAVVHRDYANASDIQVKIHDDRLTIFSPGKLYGGLTLTELATDHYQSQTRNKLIAEAFYLTKNIEKYGSGLIRIRKELEAYPGVSLLMEETSGGVLVTFALTVQEHEGVNEGVYEGVYEGVNSLFVYISNNPGQRVPDFSRGLAVPAKTIERWLKQLRTDNRIVFKGSPKTGGYYCVEG